MKEDGEVLCEDNVLWEPINNAANHISEIRAPVIPLVEQTEKEHGNE